MVYSRDWKAVVIWNVHWALVASGNKTRELHTGTAGKSQGRRKKKIQPSAVQIAKPTSSGIEKEDDAGNEDYSLDSEDKESKGQSKRRSLQARHWGVQLASLSQTQLQLAVRLVFLGSCSCLMFGEAAIEADRSWVQVFTTGLKLETYHTMKWMEVHSQNCHALVNQGFFVWM